MLRSGRPERFDYGTLELLSKPRGRVGVFKGGRAVTCRSGSCVCVEADGEGGAVQIKACVRPAGGPRFGPRLLQAGKDSCFKSLTLRVGNTGLDGPMVWRYMAAAYVYIVCE